MKNLDKLDWEIMAKAAGTNRRILDLGCGGGNFLHYLKLEQNCKVQGIDQDQESVITCITKGIPVIQNDLAQGLSYFPDQSFDLITMSRSFQQIKEPHILLKEALRVAEKVIVSVHNLGYWKYRLQLGLLNRMPHSDKLPYEWYNTPNIHMGTISDFRDMCKKEGLYIYREESIGGPASKISANIFAPLCVFTLSEKNLSKSSESKA